jgi:hypothetical protein
MKKLISIIIVLVMTVASQSPTITQTAQFTVGQTAAHDIKVWGDDLIASRFTYESGSALPYHQELILLNKFGEVIWRKFFPPAIFVQRTQLAIKNMFCILTVGDSLYKIDKEGVILQKVCVPTADQSLGAQNQQAGVIFMEGNTSSSQSKFFVYNENLDLVRVIAGQPGATYSVSNLRDAYFVSGTKYGGGLISNLSSHIAKYDTTGNLLWSRQFPDVTSMHLVINRERLYFCGINKGYPYQRMVYGELTKDTGDTIWVRQWGAPYPDTFLTVLTFSQIQPSPDGGFVAIGATTAPGQNWTDYEPNLPVGLILGHSPGSDCLWVKTTNDFGGLLSGDWKDSSLVVLGNLGSFPNVAAKAIIYSISGLTAMEDNEPGPKDFSLGQNYPNPFNPSTKIKFSLTAAGLASLRVYDLLGREVATLVNDKELLAGEYEASFEASSLVSGIYICTLSVVGRTETRKMVLLR